MNTAPLSIDPEVARQARRRNVIALVCGIWFLLTGWFWAYLANVVISFPFAVLGFFSWRAGRRLAPGSTLNKVAGGFLVAGAILSVAALLMFK